MNTQTRQLSLASLLLGLLLLSLALPAPAQRLTLDITGGTERALPIAIVPFALPEGAQRPSEDVAEIITSNLTRSGKFEPVAKQDLISRPSRMEDVRFQQWRALGVDNIVVGSVSPSEDGGYELRYELLDVYQGTRLLGKRFRVQNSGMRSLAHTISDQIYEAITGTPGAFTTQVAYVQVEEGSDQRRTHRLLIADADGMRPQTILTSQQPLMSPAWSPDRRQLAYVSFEDNNRSSIWVQTISTGQRRQVASFSGINSAPTWSPDGRRLALTLSRDGTPNIYVLDLESNRLTQITRSSSIDTEAVFSADGRQLYFTSDRGGRPQIYRVSSSGGNPERVTFEGSYNARPDISPDGKHLAMVTRDDSGFRIGLMDLKTRELRLLTGGSLDESPSFSSNGEMIVYSRVRGGRGQLATVSIHGRANLALPVTGNRVQDPAWSPR